MGVFKGKGRILADIWKGMPGCGFYPAMLGVSRLTVLSCLVKLVVREVIPHFGPRGLWSRRC